MTPEGNEEGPRLRDHYIAALNQLVPFDKQEEEDIATTITWLRSANQVHKLGSPEQHLGVLNLLLSPDRASIFLTLHRKAQIWLPPGGHVDENVRLQKAVEEEMDEELGAKAEFYIDQPIFHVRTLTQGANAGHTDVTLWFLLKGTPNHPYKILEKEATDARWFTIDEVLADPAMAHLHRGLKKIKERFLKNLPQETT